MLEEPPSPPETTEQAAYVEPSSPTPRPLDRLVKASLHTAAARASNEMQNQEEEICLWSTDIKYGDCPSYPVVIQRKADLFPPFGTNATLLLVNPNPAYRCYGEAVMAECYYNYNYLPDIVKDIKTFSGREKRYESQKGLNNSAVLFSLSENFDTLSCGWNLAGSNRSHTVVLSSPAAESQIPSPPVTITVTREGSTARLALQWQSDVPACYQAEVLVHPDPANLTIAFKGRNHTGDDSWLEVHPAERNFSQYNESDSYLVIKGLGPGAYNAVVRVLHGKPELGSQEAGLVWLTIPSSSPSSSPSCSSGSHASRALSVPEMILTTAALMLFLVF